MGVTLVPCTEKWRNGLHIAACDAEAWIQRLADGPDRIIYTHDGWPEGFYYLISPSGYGKEVAGGATASA